MRIVSFSLWGNSRRYWNGAVKNIELVRKQYPTFIPRFYVDFRCEPSLIKTLEQDNVEIIIVEEKGDQTGMFWRFFASADDNVDIALIRDCDSAITDREVLAVNEWLDSDKDFHIMRDHGVHFRPIHGGMWGSRNKLMQKIDLLSLIKNNKHGGVGYDESFLGEEIYPRVHHTAFEHSSNAVKFKNDTHPFNPPRDEKNHIGKVVF